MNINLLKLPDIVSTALLVLTNEYGTGEERKKNLKEAGYDYQKVQNCVNELCDILEKYGD